MYCRYKQVPKELIKIQKRFMYFYGKVFKDLNGSAFQIQYCFQLSIGVWWYLSQVFFSFDPKSEKLKRALHLQFSSTVWDFWCSLEAFIGFIIFRRHSDSPCLSFLFQYPPHRFSLQLHFIDILAAVGTSLYLPVIRIGKYSTGKEAPVCLCFGPTQKSNYE